MKNTLKQFFRDSLKPGYAIIFFKNVSAALKSGVPIDEALDLFEQDCPKKYKKFFAHLQAGIEEGIGISAALESAPIRVPEIAIALVRSGEMSGNLDENMTKAAAHIERALELRRKVLSAMLYPSMVFFAMLAVTLLLVMFVLPRLVPLFNSIDMELPRSTQFVLAFSAFFESYGLVVVLGSLWSIPVLLIFAQLQRIKPIIHRVLLTIPYIRGVQRNSILSYIASTVGTLLASGVPIREALKTTSLSTTNRIYRRALLHTLLVVEEGNTLTAGMRENSKLFPKMFCTIVDIGEKTGSLSGTLEHLSNHYISEVDYSLKKLTTMIEPALLIVTGVIVGGVILSVLSPIYMFTSSF